VPDTTVTTDWDREARSRLRIERLLGRCPWTLRVTEHADRPVPLFIIKERITPSENGNGASAKQKQPVLRDRGILYGQSQRRCLPTIQTILSRVTDDQGIPLELHRLLNGGRVTFRGNLPLDEEAGCKLALIFKLQERVAEMDRVELIARRVDRFTEEEAAYWHSRITNFGEAANRWARAGMRIMLGGQRGDPAIDTMLARLRSTY